MNRLILVSLSLHCFTSSLAYAQEEEFGGETPPIESVCETPDVLVLLDRSGSMLDDDKWGQATSAISEVFVPYFNTLRFGLMTFPTSGSCGVSEGELAISLGDANEGALNDIYANSTPNDESLTPLSEAIRVGHLALEDAQIPNRRGYLILLTDGIETCAPVALEDSAPIAAARNAADAGFNTYVIGFGSLVKRSTLREMARVGGTERERLVADQSQLTDTLSEIIDSATTERCDRLDNDCDGRVDEGLDCGPNCNARLEDCPCNNNQDCALGETCEEGLCAPPPCSTLCDEGYVCYDNRCVREGREGDSDTTSEGSTFSPTTPESNFDNVAGQESSSSPMESTAVNSEQSCQSAAGNDRSPLATLTLISLALLAYIKRRALCVG